MRLAAALGAALLAAAGGPALAYWDASLCAGRNRSLCAAPWAEWNAASSSAFVGVNLGGWLVLEPWMWREAMESKHLNDEWSFIANFGGPADPRAQAVMRTHWDQFLRPEHLDKLHRFGVTHVRIPIGYWLLDDIYDVEDGFVAGGEPYLARALQWLKERQMQAVIDLHAMPGGQAQNDGFTGRRTPVAHFFTNQTHYERGRRAIDALVKLVLQYEANSTTSGVIMGVEPLNEPTHGFWDTSPGYREFYELVVPQIRRSLPAERYMIMLSFMGSPATPTAAWLAAMRERDPDNYAGVVYDKHLYHLFGDNQPPYTLEQDVCKTCCRDQQMLRPMWSQGVPIVIGEYSLATGSANWSEPGMMSRRLADQLSLWNNTQALVGSFMWNYRILLEANSTRYMEWGLLDLVDAGHLQPDEGAKTDVSTLCPAVGGATLATICPSYGPDVESSEPCEFVTVRLLAEQDERGEGNPEIQVSASPPSASLRLGALLAALLLPPLTRAGGRNG